MCMIQKKKYLKTLEIRKSIVDYFLIQPKNLCKLILQVDRGGEKEERERTETVSQPFFRKSIVLHKTQTLIESANANCDGLTDI